MTVDIKTGEITSDMGRLAGALAKAQASFPAVTRSKTVRVTTKTGGSYSFAYAPLEAILDAVRKPLADNGLALAQLLDDGALVTVLLHESGAVLEGRTPIPATADVQAFGSAITYIRRYAIQALLGIAAEEDDDGNTASGNHADPTRAPARNAAPTGGNTGNGRPTLRPVVNDSAATPAASTPDGALSDDDWAGLVDGAPTPIRQDALPFSGPGLSTRDFFDRIDKAGIDRKDATNIAKRLFGQSKWKILDLTDEERAALWDELATVPA